MGAVDVVGELFAVDLYVSDCPRLRRCYNPSLPVTAIAIWPCHYTLWQLPCNSGTPPPHGPAELGLRAPVQRPQVDEDPFASRFPPDFPAATLPLVLLFPNYVLCSCSSRTKQKVQTANSRISHGPTSAPPGGTRPSCSTHSPLQSLPKPYPTNPSQ